MIRAGGAMPVVNGMMLNHPLHVAICQGEGDIRSTEPTSGGARRRRVEHRHRDTTGGAAAPSQSRVMVAPSSGPGWRYPERLRREGVGPRRQR